MRTSAIRKHVGAAAWKVGQSLVGRGRVQDLFEDAGCLYADVLDHDERFQVRVWLDDRGGVSGSSCTCAEGEACVHVAASLLAWQRQGEIEEGAAPAPAPASAPSNTPVAPPPALDSAEALEAWAGPRGLAFALAQRVVEVPDLKALLKNELWYLPYGTTPRDLLLQTNPSAGELSRTARTALVGWLEEQAEAVAAGRAWESAQAARLSTPPEGRGCREAWEILSAARRSLRRDAEPQAVTAAHARRLTLTEDPPEARYAPPRSAACGSGQPVTIVVRFRPEAGEAPVSCTCPGPRRAGCPHSLHAVDLLLDRVTRSRATPEQNLLEQSLGSAPWERALGALDAVLGRTGVTGEAPEAGAEAGWRVLGDSQDGLVLEPVWLRPYQGRPGLRVTRDTLKRRAARPHALPLDADRAATQALLGADLDGHAVYEALASLEGHPRVVDASGTRIAVRQTAPSLYWRLAPGGGLLMELHLGARALSEEETSVALQAATSSRWLWRMQPGTLLLAPLEAGALDLLAALEARGWAYPTEAIGPLLDRREDLARLVPVELDRELLGEPVAPDSRPLLRLDTLPDGALAVDVRVKPLAEAPAFPPGMGPEALSGVRDRTRVTVERDRETEIDEVIEALSDLPGLRPPWDSWRRYLDDPEEALELLFVLQKRSDVRVEWASMQRRVTRTAEAADVSLHAGPRRDWLGLDGVAEVDGFTAELAALLAAVREGRRFVQVDDQAWIRLGDRLRQQLEGLAAATWEGPEGLSLSPFAAAALDPLEDGGADLDVPDHLSVDREAMKAAQAAAVPSPPGLQATLRPYQRVGVDWMVRLAAWAPGCVLADDMGLGKTIQALSLLLHRRDQGPALVIAPTSVGPNWRREAQRFAPSLRARLYRGRNRAALLDDLGAGAVLITSYELALRDASKLGEHTWATLVLDEAQAIKNPTAKRSIAIGSLERRFCLALTGTPVENRTAELWSLFRVVVPGLLGSSSAFRERYAVPIERHHDPTSQDRLHRLLQPFLLRRLKREVAPELPPRLEHTVLVELSAEERSLYASARLAAVAELTGGEAGDEEARRFKILAALSRLRQLACHPRLDDPASPVASSKLARTLQLLTEAVEGGHQVLVFSQFTRHLALVRTALEAAGLGVLQLDGSTPSAERERRVDAFQNGSAPVFLISLKAGGTGLNLTAATVVVHLDPWWNPAAEDQATDRAHRIGQQAPVSVYRLVAEGTIEESIVALHAEKRALAASLLMGTHTPVRLDDADLLDLLRG